MGYSLTTVKYTLKGGAFYVLFRIFQLFLVVDLAYFDDSHVLFHDEEVEGTHDVWLESPRQRPAEY